jgi:hypothetical protein
MVWNLEDGIAEVTKRYKEKYGAMEEGYTAAFVLNDAVVILSMEAGRELKINIIAGEPERMDISLDLLEKKEA